MLEPAKKDPERVYEDPVLAKFLPIVILICIALLFIGSSGPPSS